MGVKHLYTFLCQEVRNGVFEVNMRKEVENYKRQNKGREPSIVIDLNTLHSHVYTNNHEILLGGRHAIYNERSSNMFKSLRSMGVELVFFVDGPSQSEKISTALRHHNETYTNGVRVLEAIDKDLDLSGDLRKYRLCNLSTFLHNFIDIAKNYGKVHVATLNNCNQEIANMANKIKAFAIMSQDTDFLIFEGNWRYWSTRSIDFSTLTTMEFNKTALTNCLGLSSSQMPIFGSICGNDILQYDKVQNFHGQITERNSSKFFPIANAVRGVHSIPPNLKHYDLKKLSNVIFSARDARDGINELEKSLNFYCLENMRLNHRDQVMTKIAKDPLNYIIYHILGNKECIISFIYINLKMKNFTPYYEILGPMLRRIMGVLLQHQSENLDISRKVYYKTSHSQPYKLVIETPIYPKYKVPTIRQLLYQPYGEIPQLDVLRWDLLCFIISPKLNRDLLLKIPKAELTVVVTLFFLMENQQIVLDEADCLLLACNCPKDIGDVLNMDSVKRISTRDAELTFYFQKFYNLMQTCFVSVGLRSFTDLLKFDGLYFHLLRKKWSSGDQDLKYTAIDRYKSVRIYSRDFGLLEKRNLN